MNLTAIFNRLALIVEAARNLPAPDMRELANGFAVCWQKLDEGATALEPADCAAEQCSEPPPPLSPPLRGYGLLPGLGGSDSDGGAA